MGPSLSRFIVGSAVIAGVLIISGALSAGNNVSFQLDKLGRDLKSGTIHRLEAYQLKEGVESPLGITPGLFDRMVDDGVTAGLAMDHCDIAISGNVADLMGDAFIHASRTIFRSQPREIHLRLRFYDQGPAAAYTVYMGGIYTDTPDINVVIGPAATNVSQDLEDWFERHLDWKGCLIHP
jgi:hypothetical protein